jgi:hypothetical protein
MSKQEVLAEEVYGQESGHGVPCPYEGEETGRARELKKKRSRDWFGVRELNHFDDTLAGSKTRTGQPPKQQEK